MKDIIEAQYDVTKKSRIKRFYESNKIIIFSAIFFILISIISVGFYFNYKEKKNFLLSEKYVQARIYIEKGKKNEATDLLKELIFSNNTTYSSLSLFIIIDQKLITNNEELSKLFDYLLDNNKFKKEIKNMLIYKRALLRSEFITESELIEEVQPLLNNNSIWKSHTLLLLGDYFASKGEYYKAKQFYMEILSIKDVQKDLFELVKSKLTFISQ